MLKDREAMNAEITTRADSDMVMAAATLDDLSARVEDLTEKIRAQSIYKLFLGAKRHQRIMHPMEYVYDALQIKASKLPEDSPEYAVLKQYFFAGLRPDDDTRYAISNIFDVERRFDVTITKPDGSEKTYKVRRYLNVVYAEKNEDGFRIREPYHNNSFNEYAVYNNTQARQELLAVAGLESISALQLQDLAWKTREQLFIALLQEHTPSQPVAEQLRVKSRDRRLERKTERSTDTERDIVRRNEERFRGDFMQLVATELARLGAPALFTWQRLVFDRDCCIQAVRLLLTRVKSSRRSASTSSSTLGPRRSLTDTTRPRGDNNRLESETDDNSVRDDGSDSPARTKDSGVLPHLGRPPLRKGGRALAQRSLPEWNAGTACDDLEPDARSEDATAPEISIHRVRPPVTSSSSSGSGRSGVASKLQRSQLQSLQLENTALQQENARLREDVAALETLVTTLQQADVPAHSPSETEAEMALLRRRLALLDAQNVQLRRQLSLLHDALQERETVETALHATLHHWREIVEHAREDAAQAGADREAPRQPDGKPAKWMFAAPTTLLDELRRVDQQLHSAQQSMARAMEERLRVGVQTAAFLADSGAARAAAMPPGLAHLRLDRVRQLERSLAEMSRTLVAFHEQVVQTGAASTATPTLVTRRDARGSDGGERPKTAKASDDDAAPATTTGPTSATATAALLRSIRSLVLEVGALGVVVPVSAVASRPDGESSMTAAQALTTLRTLGISAPKEREKAVVAMLRQVAASEAALQADAALCRRAAQCWEHAWTTQQSVATTLLRRARRVAESKFQWWTAQVAAPWRALEDVWRGFERAQAQGVGAHKNPFLPALVETLARDVVPTSRDALDRWQQQADAWTRDLDAAMDDFLANCEALSKTMHY
ncbi:hypothetical protein P43SY_000861 [Pythium insidiosum]|uniref:Uncharacterized protein n=1 Tax=Pythium insidiosum TaxID=114742 RepID=A0AAD5M6R2_PYTIN|nr:hypothetical protein P43SY_000861 [Pythium insidiosum]